MKTSVSTLSVFVTTTSMTAILLASAPSVAVAQATPSAGQLARIDALLAEQARQIAEQNDRLAAQGVLINRQQAELDALKADRAAPIETAAAPSGPPAAQSALTPAPPASATTEAAAAPEAPLPGAADDATGGKIRPSLLAAIPEGMGVLTPTKRFVFEPAVDYYRSGTNRLVIQGVEILSPLQPALLNATQATRDVVVASGTLRYGLTDRIELEARVPFVYRNDRLTLAQSGAPGSPSAYQTTDLNSADIGDVELAARYQINAAREGQPTFVANLRLKTPTGRSPYDVDFDAAGTATSLATGTGFWALEPSLTVLVPSDPIVIFANVGYLHNFSRDINKTVGLTHVGEVDPGDEVNTAFGFGFALNPKFAFSLGYSNSYIFETTQQLGLINQHYNALEVGALIFGWSYRLRNNLLISTNFQFGVTPDAPNLKFTLRMPISF